MAYALTYSFTAPPGSTLEAQLVDASFADAGAAQSGSSVIHEFGGGLYGAVLSIPDSHRGFALFRVAGGGALYGAFAVNPQEGENSDAKTSAVPSSLLATAVAATDLSAKTTQTVADCLSAARADGAGEWALTGGGTTLTIYGPGGETVRTFTTDSATKPTVRQ